MFVSVRPMVTEFVVNRKVIASLVAILLAFAFQVVAPSSATTGNEITVTVTGGPASTTVDVSLSGPQSPQPQQINTDGSGSGSTTFTALADGSYAISVQKIESGHKTYTSQMTERIVSASSSTATANIPLVQLTSIAVTVSGIPANTSLLSGTFSSLSSFIVPPTSTSNPTTTQVVDIYEVPAGSWTLNFAADSSASGSTTVLVTSGVPAVANVNLTAVSTATGIVRNSEGTPISGAVVSLYSQGMQGGNPCGSGQCFANTDSNGEFTISGLNTSNVSATVSYTVGSTTISKSGINFTNVPGTPNQLTLPSGSSNLQGTVKNDSTEVAIAGATVQLSFTGLNNSNLSIITTTDISGLYEFENIPSGSVMAFTYKNSGQNSLYLSSSESINLSASQSKIFNIYLRDRPTGSGVLTGTVTDSSTSATIQNASVNITNVMTSVPSFASTDSAGQYSISSLPAGVYRVSVSSMNHVYKGSLVSITSGSVTKNFTLSPKPTGNATVSGTVLDIRTGLPVSGANVNIYSLAGSFHSAQTAADGTWSIANVANGTYNFNINAPMGSPLVFSYQERAPIVISGSNVVRNDGLRSVVAGTASITGNLKNVLTHEPLAGATIVAAMMSSGFNIDPVITNSRGEFSFTGLPAGQITVLADLEGYVGIEIVNPEESEQGGGFGPGYPVGTIDLEEGEQAKLFAKLRPEVAGTNSVSGTVRTSLNRPIENMYVNLRTEAGLYIPGVQTDANGQFEISGLADGDYVISSSSYSSSYGMSEARFSINGADVIQDLTLAPSGLITGSVLDGDGKPVSCAVVTAYRVNSDGTRGELVSSSMADYGTPQAPGAGTYSLSYLAQGNYFLRLSQQCWNTTTPVTTNFASGFWSNSNPGITDTAQISVSVTAGAVTADKNFVVGNTGAAMSGTIVTATPQGEVALSVGKYALVSIYKLVSGTYQVQGYLSRWVSGRDGGSFTLNGLPSGSYKIKITDPMNSSRGIATTFLGGEDLASAEVFTLSAGDDVQLGNLIVTQKVPTEAASAVDTNDLTSSTEDQIVAPDSVEANQTISVTVGEDMAGEWVSVWAHSTPTPLGDWVQVGADGTVTATVSEALPSGNHRIVVQDIDDQVVGWTATTVASTAEGSASVGGTTRKKTSALSNIGTVVPLLDSPVQISAQKKSSNPKQAAEADVSDTAEESPNFWVLGGLAAILAAGIVGGVWLIRSRRS